MNSKQRRKIKRHDRDYRVVRMRNLLNEAKLYAEIMGTTYDLKQYRDYAITMRYLLEKIEHDTGIEFGNI